MSTYDEVVDIIASEIKVAPEAVKAASALQDLNIESLEMIEITMAIETKLSVELPDRELQSVTSLQDLVALVDKAKAGRNKLGAAS